VLTTYALGSCIGLAVHDRQAGVGGLLHFMLPDSSIDPQRARDNPFLFADTGIPLLIQKVRGTAGPGKRLVAYAAGGAQMMDRENVFEIGKRNSLAMRKILWKAGVLLESEAVGGDQSRTMRFEIGTGRVWLHEGGTLRELAPAIPRQGGFNGVSHPNR
jgi:chemotaxis protein CheD